MTLSFPKPGERNLRKSVLRFLLIEKWRTCETGNMELVCMQTLDKRKYLIMIWDNFCHFCTKTYVVTLHLNRLDETVQMKGHNICFH